MQGAVLKNNKIVFFGGKQLDIYNIVTGHWSIGALNQTNISGAVIKVNNTIYIGSGALDNTHCSVITQNKVYTLIWLQFNGNSGAANQLNF